VKWLGWGEPISFKNSFSNLDYWIIPHFATNVVWYKRKNTITKPTKSYFTLHNKTILIKITTIKIPNDKWQNECFSHAKAKQMNWNDLPRPIPI
jgi:hypothetical protein